MVVLELYYKGAEQLIESLLPNVIQPLHRRLQDAGYGGLSRVLLTYKGRPSAVDNPRDAKALRAALPAGVAVAAVWSAKNAFVGSGKNARGEHANREDATFHRFVEYNRSLETAGASSILVVSGAGAKKALDSCETLRRAASIAPPPLPLGVAFNPHIGGVLDPHGGEPQREQEWERLRQKLRSGACAQIWVAFGADVAALEFGLQRLRQEIAELPAGWVKPHVYGSVFVPCKAWIAKMRFRCWNGTYLGEKDGEGAYLSSVESAAAITRQTLALFAQHGVEPVVESSVRTAREVEEVMVMFAREEGGIEEREGEQPPPPAASAACQQEKRARLTPEGVPEAGAAAQAATA
jgi:hypothetical protein